jgi:hypothetical protein
VVNASADPGVQLLGDRDGRIDFGGVSKPAEDFGEQVVLG